jgi:hypothetical protein
MISTTEAPPFIMVTIYRHPADRPDAAYLARRWEIRRGMMVAGDVLEAGNDLEACRRAARSQGCDGFFPRDESDPPQVLETWL